MGYTFRCDNCGGDHAYSAQGMRPVCEACGFVDGDPLGRYGPPSVVERFKRRRRKRELARERLRGAETRWRVVIDQGEEDAFILEMGESELRVVVPVLRRNAIPYSMERIADLHEAMDRTDAAA